jgi:hypothetical protein
MDILKYIFGIDSTKFELEKIRREKEPRKENLSLLFENFDMFKLITNSTNVI